MASQRLFILLIVLTTIVATINAEPPKNVVLGERVRGDYMLQREWHKVPSKFLKTIKERKTFTGDGHSNITQVKLLDQNKKGNGATAVIVNGGPGMKYVTVEFKSKRGHSIDYIVEIYGR